MENYFDREQMIKSSYGVDIVVAFFSLLNKDIRKLSKNIRCIIHHKNHRKCVTVQCSSDFVVISPFPCDNRMTFLYFSIFPIEDFKENWPQCRNTSSFLTVEYLSKFWTFMSDFTLKLSETHSIRKDKCFLIQNFTIIRKKLGTLNWPIWVIVPSGHVLISPTNKQNSKCSKMLRAADQNMAAHNRPLELTKASFI